MAEARTEHPPRERHRPVDLTVDPRWWLKSDSRVVMALDRAGCTVLRRFPSRRLSERLQRSWRAFVHHGSRVECPLCGSRFRHFAHRPNTEGVICWSCGSEERHRSLWLLFTRQRPELLDEPRSLLHFAPEPGVERHLREKFPGRYVTADLDPTRGELTIDIASIALPDGSFEAILCSHVLEHVVDDAAAMSELSRVLAPGGWCIVMVPIDRTLAHTDEDSSITDPKERRVRFWQEDHVRLYALDVVERLRAAGFEVEHVRPIDGVSPAEVERFRLGWGDDVFICRRPSPRGLSVPTS